MILMNEEVPVLEFSYDQDRHRVGELLSLENPEWCPPSLVGPTGAITGADLDWWWSHRSLPASRVQVETLARSLDLDSFSELLEHNFALSLSDRYWVRPEGSDLAWSDVNFFDNAFSDRLGVLTLDPSSETNCSDIDGLDLMSPNSTAGGNVPKKWVIARDGTRMLVKAGTRMFDQDVYNEAVATALYETVLGDGEYVPYEVVDRPEGAVCACPNFLADGEELVSAADLLRRHRLDHGYGTYPNCLSAMAETGLPLGLLSERMSCLFCLDALMANSDRHTGNFGLIRDCQTLEYKGFAPFYDCGCSLWCDRRSLSSPSDYSYSPRPFVGAPSESPWRQLRLFDDYGWVPGDWDLGGWVDDARDILSTNPLLPDARLEAILRGIELNVDNFARHIEAMDAISRNDVPRRR